MAFFCFHHMKEHATDRFPIISSRCSRTILSAKFFMSYTDDGLILQIKEKKITPEKKKNGAALRPPIFCDLSPDFSNGSKDDLSHSKHNFQT